MMLKDRWYNGLKVIDVIGYSKIDQLMENKKVWIFITNIWIGPYERNYVTSMSTNHEILFTMNKNTKFTLYNYVSDKSNQLLKWLKHPKKKISKLFKERNHNRKAHIFQFENWKQSIDSLYFVDWICVIAIAVIFQVLLYRVLSNSLTLQSNLKTIRMIRSQILSSIDQSQFLSYQSQLQQLDQDTLNLMEYAYTNYDLFCNLILIQTGYFIKSIFKVIYAKLRKKVVEKFTGEQLINLVTFVIVVVTFLRWRLDFSQRTNIDPRYNKFSCLSASFNTTYLNTLISSAIILWLQWSRVFLVLELSKTFGPMIEIIYAMIKLIVVFTILFAAILVIFIFTGVVLFYDLNEFKTFDSAFRYLFSAALGNFDFSIYEQGMTVSKNIGYIYIILYEILMNITLLNFLIGILSEIYVSLKDKSTSLYHKNIVRINQVQFLKQRYYSSLVAAPPPFNLFVIPFAPFLILKQNEKLNTFLMHMCYIPVLITSITIFSWVIVIMLPFAYLTLVLSQIRSFVSWGFNSLKSFLIEILLLLFIVFWGVFLLIALSMVDLYYFTINLYSKERELKYSSLREANNGLGNIDPDLFKLFMKKVTTNDNECISTRDLVVYFRENLKIIDQICNIIFRTDAIDTKKFIYEENKPDSINNQTYTSNLMYAFFL